MSIWTKEELLTHIQAYKEALLSCSQGKSYSVGSRSLTRSDIPEIKSMLDYYESELGKLENRKTALVVQARVHGFHRWR